ncbi:MAG: diguanylate cyclase [Rhodanobacteraceae bacterium]|nr:MAG: diguanylate cyclase [Rhodanobacteraceae bacterium]
MPLRNTDGWIYGILSVARDMSHRVANEERLRLWALAFEHAGFGIVLSDSPRRRILAANPKFADERGHAPEAPTGMHADGLYPADPRPTHEAAREAHMGGGTFVAMPQQAVTAEQCLVQLVGESTGRLREVLQDPFRPDLAAPVAITASAGWTSIDPERGSPDSAYKEAELAMYRAKANGRDRACYFEPATQHAPEHAERLLRKL